MRKRRKVASVAFTGVAALGAVGFTAGHAQAASGTWNVSPGGAYTAKNATGTSPTLGDTTTGATLTCTSAAAAGSLVKTATGNSPSLGPINTATFAQCSLLGAHFTAALTHAAKLHASQPVTASGVTKGYLSSISAKITGVSGFSCSATVTGTHLPGSYNNSGTLTIDPTKSAALTVTHTNGACLGAINSNDKAYFSAKYAVTPVQTITN